MIPIPRFTAPTFTTAQGPDDGDAQTADSYAASLGQSLAERTDYLRAHTPANYVQDLPSGTTDFYPANLVPGEHVRNITLTNALQTTAVTIHAPTAQADGDEIQFFLQGPFVFDTSAANFYLYTAPASMFGGSIRFRWAAAGAIWIQCGAAVKGLDAVTPEYTAFGSLFLPISNTAFGAAGAKSSLGNVPGVIRQGSRIFAQAQVAHSRITRAAGGPSNPIGYLLQLLSATGTTVASGRVWTMPAAEGTWAQAGEYPGIVTLNYEAPSDPAPSALPYSLRLTTDTSGDANLSAYRSSNTDWLIQHKLDH